MLRVRLLTLSLRAALFRVRAKIRRSARFIIPCLLFLVTACAGFEPIYAERKGDASMAVLLNEVRFESTHERSGQILYTAFYELFKTRAERAVPRYILKVDFLDIARSDISLAADGTSLLEQIVVIGDFSLTRIEDYTELGAFRVRNVSTYNVVGADAYGTLSAFESTRERLLYDMAAQVRLRVAAMLREES